MEDLGGKPMPAAAEQKIPVFTVLKKCVIIKNIFFNSPPPTLKSEEDDDGGCEFLMGRHPDCEVMVDHPSISRFHLKVRRLRRTLFVTDLFSVHGSFVSGKKIEPGVPVELLEGDLLKLGASTRVYVLRWVRSSDAFRLEKPLTALQEEIEEEHTDVVPPPEVVHNGCSDEVVPELEEESEEMSFLTCSSPLPDFGGFTEILQPAPVGEQLRSPEMENPAVFSGILSRRTKSNRILRVLTGSESICTEKAQEEESVSKVLFPGSVDSNEQEEEEEEEEEDEEVYDSDKENMTPQHTSYHKSRKTQKGLMSPLRLVSNLREFHGVTSDEENMIQPESSRRKSSNTTKAGEQSLCKVLCFGNTEEEEGEKESYSSDKENRTPEFSGDGHRKGKEPLSENRLRIESRIAKRKGLERDRVPFQCLLDFSISTNSNTNNTMSQLSDSRRSNSENTNITKRRVESSVPFQSLFEAKKFTISESSNVSSSFSSNQNENFNLTNNSGTSSTLTNVNSSSSGGGRSKKWNMVADISCFLNDDSRRSLQLLEGIRGTHLIIPRMVLRELDCLKRGESLFRKGTKNASSILQWIEKCMVQTGWWIHVQSSEEMMAQLQTATPPSTPTIPVGGGGDVDTDLMTKKKTCSSSSSLAEVVSPTADDHILDCAIQFKKKKEQFVLLTQSISLKIKAMAEGILCETATEFRESLVSPYSERFLWEESSPRGATWSCSDELELVQSHYHHCPTLRKSVKAAEGAKGLKLILLHNAKYGGGQNLAC